LTTLRRAVKRCEDWYKFTNVSEILTTSIFRAITLMMMMMMPVYTALQPRRQTSSYTPPSEPQILLSKPEKS
jgi:hypothetical protein